MSISVYKTDLVLWIVLQLILNLAVALDNDNSIMACDNQNRTWSGPINDIRANIHEVLKNRKTNCTKLLDYSNYSVCIEQEVSSIITSFLNVHLTIKRYDI